MQNSELWNCVAILKNNQYGVAVGRGLDPAVVGFSVAFRWQQVTAIPYSMN